MNRRAAAVAAALGLSLSLALVSCHGGRGANGPANGPLSPAQIAQRWTPSIVSVTTEVDGQKAGYGSGFVVRADGWVATNLHVLLDPPGITKVTLAFPDGREETVAEIVRIDPVHDLVVMRIDAKGLKPLTLGDSDAVRPGDAVVVIGHPLQLENTVSNGLVSGVRIVDKNQSFIQISAPISPGSSGGPVFNDRGEVIGTSSFIIDPSRQGARGAENLNFAMPSRYLKALLDKDMPALSVTQFGVEVKREAESQQEQLPAPQRPQRPTVPIHELAVLDGCSVDDMKLIIVTVGQAIDTGAPLYNQGHFAACFDLYKDAANLLVQKLPASCTGPGKALGDGLTKAAAAKDPKDAAWAMRDAFDGLIYVIERKVSGEK